MNISFITFKKSQKHLARISSDSSKKTQTSNFKNMMRMKVNQIVVYIVIKYLNIKLIFKIKNEQEKGVSEIEEMKLQIKQLIEANLNNSQTVQKSMCNQLCYAKFQECTTNGLIKGKKLDGFIEYNGNTDRSIQEIIIHYFEKRKLHQLLGDLIVKEYKKENPKNQFVWSSDVSEHYFLLRKK